MNHKEKQEKIDIIREMLLKQIQDERYERYLIAKNKPESDQSDEDWDAIRKFSRMAIRLTMPGQRK